MNTVIEFNESVYIGQKEGYESLITDLQQAVDSYNALGFQPLAKEEFSRLFNDFEVLVFDKMTEGKPIVMGGLEIHKDKALEILKKPAGYEGMKHFVDKAKQSLKSAEFTHPLNKSIAVSNVGIFYELNDAGLVQFNALKDEELKRLNTKIAASDNAIKMLDLANTIIDKCKELDLLRIVSQEPNGLGFIINHLIESKWGVELLKVNASNIAKFNQQGFTKF
jgi:hypothetical protein